MIRLLPFLLFLLPVIGMAQYPDSIHNGDLRAWLKENTYDGEFGDLGYNQARIQMYSFVDEVDGKINCVYTGFQQDAESTTFLDPINAEHVVPQSFYGSQSPMKSDIHNLRPTHSSANSERGNLGFDEVPDESATWIGVYGNSYSSNTVEPANNETFSEKYSSDWEPREDRKGDIARQVFYFYTMYPTVAGSIAAIGDLETLYEWHLYDPVSPNEITRNNRAEIAQGNRNPYIDYEELVYDAWLWEQPESVGALKLSNLVEVFPNPGLGILNVNLRNAANVDVEISNTNGELIFHGTMNNNRIAINTDNWSAGVYLIGLRSDNEVAMKRWIKL